MVGQQSRRFIEIDDEGKAVVLVFLVVEGHRHMIAVAERVRAVIILQNVQVPKVLGFETKREDRVRAFLMIDDTVGFDDGPPATSCRFRLWCGPRGWNPCTDRPGC